MDAQMGRILAELELLGLAETTVVLFLVPNSALSLNLKLFLYFSLYTQGDHGLHMGEHAEWDKQTNFELAHRAPLLLRVPGAAGGVVTDGLAEFVDIYPTLVEAAGLPPLAKCPDYSRFNTVIKHLCKTVHL